MPLSLAGRSPRFGALSWVTLLVQVTHRGVPVEERPVGHGTWRTTSELDTLARRERDSWIGRCFYRPRPVV